MQTPFFKPSLISALYAVSVTAFLVACGGSPSATFNSPPTGSITVKGSPVQGEALIIESTLAGATLEYQWLADGVAISGATSSSFTPGPDQIGKALSVVVSYTDGSNTHQSVTKAIEGVVVFGSITVKGSPVQGEALIIESTLAGATLEYKWLADGVAISGETSSSFTPGSDLIGKALSVVVSYTDGANTHQSVTKAVEGVVVWSASNLQGIWNAGTVGGDQASAVVLSNGNAWIVVNHAGQAQMYAATLQGTATGYIGSGKQYISGSKADPISVSFAPTVVSKATLGGTLTPTGQSALPLSFSYDARYETASLLGDMKGTWKGTKSAGSIQVTWDITASGALTGISTAGCMYKGTIAAHSVPVPVGVFDLTLSETCSNLGTSLSTDFAGIVTLNAAKTNANFAFTTSTGSQGDVQSTTRQ